MVLERPGRQNERSRTGTLRVGLYIRKHGFGEFDVTIVLYVNLGYRVLIKGIPQYVLKIR
jgi:hypothetical protein